MHGQNHIKPKRKFFASTMACFTNQGIDFHLKSYEVIWIEELLVIYCFTAVSNNRVFSWCDITKCQ